MATETTARGHQTKQRQVDSGSLLLGVSGLLLHLALLVALRSWSLRLLAFFILFVGVWIPFCLFSAPRPRYRWALRWFLIITLICLGVIVMEILFSDFWTSQ